MRSHREADAAEALDYYDRGVPSTLPPGNLYKSRTERHRWGYHGPHRGRDPQCPVCQRESARDAHDAARLAGERETVRGGAT